MRTPTGKTKMQRRRMELGMTLPELAEKTGIDAKMLQKYESRQVKPDGSIISPIEGINIDRLVKIADALSCRVSDLMEDENTAELVKGYEDSLAGSMGTVTDDYRNTESRDALVQNLESYNKYLSSRSVPPQQVIEGINAITSYEKAIRQMELLKSKDPGMFDAVVKNV